MQNIKVGRYSDPKALGWVGWIEPEDLSWIAFIGLNGRPVFFLNRDPRTGARSKCCRGARPPNSNPQLLLPLRLFSSIFLCRVSHPASRMCWWNLQP